MERDGERFRHATQNGVQFKTYKLFISGISHLILLDYCSLQVTETVEMEAVDSWKLLCTKSSSSCPFPELLYQLSTAA